MSSPHIKTVVTFRVYDKCLECAFKTLSMMTSAPLPKSNTYYKVTYELKVFAVTVNGFPNTRYIWRQMGQNWWSIQMQDMQGKHKREHV